MKFKKIKSKISKDYIVRWINYKIFAVRSKMINAKITKAHPSVMFGDVDLLVGHEFISIGEDTCFANGLYLAAWAPPQGTLKDQPSITIGSNCHFGHYNKITCSNKIIIGDNLLTGAWVTITDNSHGDTTPNNLILAPLDRTIVSKGPVIIGKNVWLGDKVTILPNVKIGDGVVIGANSVVVRDVPPYTVAAGNPAKILKQNSNANE